MPTRSAITGSLLVSGSSTLTNIGPAIFSGSLIVTQGITGSLSGSALTATSASFAATASFALNVNPAATASYAVNALSASFALTASHLTGYVSPFPFTGSAIISGSLGVTGSVSATAGFSGSFSGSFQGNGSGLTNIPASGITGLNLSQIATGSISASVSPGTGSFTVTSGSSTFMFVSSSGNIGLGTTTPSQALTVNGIIAAGATGGNLITSIGGGISTYGIIGSNYYYTGNFAYRRISDAVSQINFASGGFEFKNSGGGAANSLITFSTLAVLNSSGNFLINTTTDAGFRLDVNGTARVSGQLSLSSATPAIQLGGDLTISNTPYPSRSIVIDILNSNINLLAGGFGEGMFIGGRLTSSRTATTFVSPNGLNAVGSALITPYDINGNVSIQASNNGNRSIVLKGLGGGGAVLIGNITTGNGTNYSAILQADSTNQGFLPPRTNLTSNISTPAQGLMAYLTGSTNEGLYYYNSGSAIGWHKPAARH